jgi:phosphoglycolate phosphatase
MQVILFDWDGTLADSLGEVFAANEVVMKTLGLPFDRSLYTSHSTPDWRVMYRRLGVPDGQVAEANRLWIDAYDVHRATLFPGVDRALARLTEHGFRLGLVTAGHREVVAPQVARLGVEGLLPVRVFGDDTVAQKPDPGPLRLATGLVGKDIAPEAVTYVGDTREDMAMARAFGAQAIGIESALGSPEVLRAAGAVELAGSVAGWVERILGGTPGAAGAKAFG